MLYKYIRSAYVFIDRLEFSFPCLVLTEFLDFQSKTCALQAIDSGKHNDASYWHRHFRYQNSLITIKVPIKDDTKPSVYNPRFFVTVSDPDVVVQEWLKGVCWKFSKGGPMNRYSVLVKEVEVAIDLATDNKPGAEKVWRYMGRHLFTIGSRANSYRTIKTTRYVGRNGNARHGLRGARCYVKQINRRYVCRLEVQFNRPYLLKHQITYESLPLKPETLPVLDKIVVLKGFSDTGARNYARNILRKRGIKPSDHNYRAELGKEDACVRLLVLGGKRGANPAVHKQISKLKELNKKYGLAINYRNYFEQIVADKALINCLVDIGKEDDELCSKRLVMIAVNNCK